MKNLSVKFQLTMAFGVLAVLVLVVSLLSLRSLGESNDRFTSYVEGGAERETLVTSVRAMVNARAISARNLVLVTTPEDREAEYAKVVKAHEQVQASMKTLEAAAASGVGATDRDRALVAEISRVEAAYGPVALAIVKLAREDHRDEAIAKMNNDCRPLLAALLKSAGDYLDYSATQTKASVEQAAAAYRAQRMMLIAASAFAVVAAAVLGWLITRRLVAALGAEPAALSAAAQRVADGDLSPIAGVSGADAGSVLASMGAMQGQLVELIS
jgi:methyl-accepting chemotaxis protein-1 (serine sensor receptor)